MDIPPPLPSSPPPFPIYIPLTLDEENIVEGATEILNLVRPNWSTSNSPIKSKEFNEGLSNKLVGFFIQSKPKDMVIVKVFGPNAGALADRHSEVETMQILHQRKCGAELYATFDNGICYEFINGFIPEIEECKLPTIYRLIAAEMGRWHSSPKGNNGPAKTNINPFWEKMIKLNQLAEETLEQNPAIKQRLSSFGVTAGWATNALSELRRKLEEEDIPITFCHNDISCKNIVIDESKERATFIDVEYAGYNYPPFDVANHFMEFMGVSLPLDFSKCPDKKWRLDWITEYLKHFRLGEVTIKPEKFNEWVELCTPLSDIYWCLWATVQAAHSTIDYDFLEYVGQRFVEYNKNAII